MREKIKGSGKRNSSFPLSWNGYERKSEDMTNLNMKDKDINGGHLSYR